MVGFAGWCVWVCLGFGDGFMLMRFSAVCFVED